MDSFNDTFLKACRGDAVPYTPVWFMRQAGRYLSEYQSLRQKYGLLEIARTPELAAQVTLQPVDALGVDAAILFADILLPLEPMGCPFSFQKGDGPIMEKPIRSKSDIEHLEIFYVPKELDYVGKAIKILARELKERIPLIGFAGGPFTLASYMVEGSKSHTYRYCKELMFQNPPLWHQLLEKISRVTMDYLSHQIESGVQAIQLFDSWIGCLSPEDYEKFVFPHSQRILQTIGQRYPSIPRIHFGTGTGMLLPLMHQAGASVVGIDWQTPLSFARKTLGPNVPVQGNLDPLALFAPASVLREKIAGIVTKNNGLPGHIFNLGHGIIPETPVESVKLVVKEIHERTQS